MAFGKYLAWFVNNIYSAQKFIHSIIINSHLYPIEVRKCPRKETSAG